MLITVPHGAAEGTQDSDPVDTESHDPEAADTGVRPVQLIYTDNNEESGYDYLMDADENAMADQTEDITWYAMDEGDLDEDREAHVRSVEVWGDLSNFAFMADANGGAEIVAYEAYQYASICKYYALEVSFEYGPLAKQTKGAFGIQANGATDQCHQNGSYITLIYKDKGYDGTANYSDIDPLTGADSIEDLVKAGYCYLHTDIAPSGSNKADDDEMAEGSSEFPADYAYQTHGFYMGLSLSPEPQGEHDSVFYVKLTPDSRKKTIAVKASYGITGSGSWTECVSNCWAFYDGTDDIADLEDAGDPVQVGQAFIDFGDAYGEDSVEYKVVARDAVGALIEEAQGDCPGLSAAEEEIVSRIGKKRVVLVLREAYTQECPEDDPTGDWDTDYPEATEDAYILLNGVTDDVDITYNFYDKDGDFNVDFDRTKIFDYAMDDGWNLLPIRVDKVYYSTSSAPSTRAKYPDGENRTTAKVKVDSVSDAIIGLDEDGEPVIACDSEWIFGLDANGVAYGKASDINYLKAGYGYAIDVDVDVDESLDLYTFGYNMPCIDCPSATTYAGGAALTANVIDVDKPSDVRSSKNCGWNLIADVADITLSGTTYVDYVITFNVGDFDSWIRDASAGLSDFTVMTNDYAEALDEDETDEDVVTGYFRGKAYFVHTESK